MRTQLTIGTKIMASVGLLLALTLVISVAGLISAGHMERQFAHAVDITVQKLMLSDAIAHAESEMVAAQRLMIIGAALKNESVHTGARTFRAKMEFCEKSIRLLEPLLVTGEGRTLVSELKSKYSEWQPKFEELERAVQTGNPAEADRVRAEKIAPVYTAIERAASRLSAIENELLEADKQAMASSYSVIRLITLALLALSLLVGVVVVIAVRRIVRELRQAATQLQHGAVQLAGAASHVSSSSQSLAQSASEQAASLEETSASSEEINAVAQRNSDLTRSAAELVANAQKKFAETNGTLGEMVTAMDEINQSSEKVSKIIKVIDEVAFQTNILALNAAVEAARAGDAGMGFAVVADEVRNLAQRCAQAARETASLIEESVGQSQHGKAKVDQVACAIRSITEDAGKIKTLVDEVNVASQEQSNGIEQVAKAITQMDSVTQGVAASAEESASAAEELTTQSVTLKDVAARLTAMVGSE